MRPFALILLMLPLLLTPYLRGAGGDYLVYVGTYTGAKSKGIYAYRFNPATGNLTEIGLVGEITSPSFLAVDPKHRFLYAVNEVSDFKGQKSGAVSAFSIDRATGKLKLLNTVSSHGGGPCHLNVDHTGKNLLVANYDGGSVAAFPIMKDGRLAEASAAIQHVGSGADPKRQTRPHAHSIQLSADNKFAVATDLGLDEVLVYRFDPKKGALTPNDPPFAKVDPGAGPRHFAWHPSGKYAYVIDEMGMTVTAFSYEATRGVFQSLQTISTLPEGVNKDSQYSTAEIEVDPKGKFLYGSNRGHDSIAVFAIDAGTGKLTPIENVPTQGKTPRNFALDPTGAWLFAANQDSDNIALFRVDPQSGRLTPAGKSVQVGSPVCVLFVK